MKFYLVAEPSTRNNLAYLPTRTMLSSSSAVRARTGTTSLPVLPGFCPVTNRSRPAIQRKFTTFGSVPALGHARPGGHAGSASGAAVTDRDTRLHQTSAVTSPDLLHGNLICRSGSCAGCPHRSARRARHTIALDRWTLTVAQVADLARGNATAHIGSSARARIAQAAARGRTIAERRPIYGYITGAGANRTTLVPDEATAGFGMWLPHSHSGGIGALAPDDQPRSTLAVRANQLLAGGSARQSGSFSRGVDGTGQ